MSYLERLEEKLEELGYKKRYKNLCITYAKTIFNNNVPVIFDNGHLALLLGIKKIILGYYIHSTDRFYNIKYISKKAGGYRKISMPSYNLKRIQRWILENILYNIPTTEYSTGFVKGKSIVDNALPHVNKEVIINIDIKDFFPSIKFKAIFNIFYTLGYTVEISYSLAKLLTFNGELPQGSPASPYISNIILKKLDYRIAGFCKKKSISYSRYADDITISGNKNITDEISFLLYLINDEGFTINTKKIKVLSKKERQEVTGLVVNNSVKVKKEIKKDIRKNIYYCKKYGVYNHLKYTGCEDKAFFREYIYGKVYFVKMVEPDFGEKLLLELNEIDWNS